MKKLILASLVIAALSAGCAFSWRIGPECHDHDRRECRY